MLEDQVRELVETVVSSRLKQVEEEVEELKNRLKALTDEFNVAVGKLQPYVFKSYQDSDVTRHAKTLKQWTGKWTANVVYDSNVCLYTADSLFRMVKDKPNIAIVATTTDGDVFGGFYSVAVTQQDQFVFDPNMFIFTFESHGRCKTPQRFVVKKEMKDNTGVYFFKNDNGQFVGFDGGEGDFYLGNEKSNTYCDDLSGCFEGIENTTLTGKTGFFTCSRLVAVQLE